MECQYLGLHGLKFPTADWARGKIIELASAQKVEFSNSSLYYREQHSFLRCFSSTVILSRNQFSTFVLWENGHNNRNVAKAQTKAEDISRGNKMVKLKTNEPITKKKQTLRDGWKGATPVGMQGAARSQHAAGRDRISRSAAGVSVSI